MIFKANKKKIFMGLSEVAGFYVGLEQGFKELGQKVTRIDLSQHRFKYKSAHSNFLLKCYFFCANKSSKNKFWKALTLSCKSILFVWAAMTHDVFIFSYGTSFFRLHDLRILKWLGKKIIFQFHGSDSRPPFMDGIFIKQYSLAEVFTFTATKKAQIAMINKYADAVIDLPTMGLFHTKAFINCLQLGLPTNVVHKQPVQHDRLNESVKILHAPSNALAKGTAQIEATINELQQQGLNITLIKIQNLPNEKVMEALTDCDFVIDQMFSDTLMPGFATEAAWHKKPTILCGYAKDLWLNSLPENLTPPTYYCHPHDLKEAIQKLYNDLDYRLQLGEAAYDFVSCQWQPKKIAQKYLDIFNGNSDKDWYINPADLRYIHGCCIEEQDLKSFLCKMLTTYGVGSLHLDDKPLLKRNFLRFTGCHYD